MNTSTVIFKIDPKSKKEAQQVAEDLGFTLSSLLKAYLKNLIHTKKVNFELPEEERELSDWAIKRLKEAEKNEKEGYVSPRFSTVEEMEQWLNDPNARYENGHSAR